MTLTEVLESIGGLSNYTACTNGDDMDAVGLLAACYESAEQGASAYDVEPLHVWAAGGAPIVDRSICPKCKMVLVSTFARYAPSRCTWRGVPGGVPAEPQPAGWAIVLYGEDGFAVGPDHNVVLVPTEHYEAYKGR